MRCSEIWGGIRNKDVETSSVSLEASLISLACDGGKGGDIYYFSVCDDGVLTRIVLADVIGHGESVSRVSSWLLKAMRERMNTLDGNRVLADLNGLAAERGVEAMTTAAVAAFYREESHLYFAYAGHHPMLLLPRAGARANAVEIAAKQARNLPLGVCLDTCYQQQHIRLSPGDRVALYTDGLIDAPDVRGEPFGLHRLLQVLKAHAESGIEVIKHAVLSAVRTHADGSLAHDDVTLLIAELK